MYCMFYVFVEVIICSAFLLIYFIVISYAVASYVTLFLIEAGELATGEQLSWFVSCSYETPEMVVAQLERLHVALQAVVALRTYLSLSSASLTQFTAQVSCFG